MKLLKRLLLEFAWGFLWGTLIWFLWTPPKHGGVGWARTWLRRRRRVGVRS